MISIDDPAADAAGAGATWTVLTFAYLGRVDHLWWLFSFGFGGYTNWC